MFINVNFYLIRWFFLFKKIYFWHIKCAWLTQNFHLKMWKLLFMYKNKEFLISDFRFEISTKNNNNNITVRYVCFCERKLWMSGILLRKMGCNCQSIWLALTRSRCDQRYWAPTHNYTGVLRGLSARVLHPSVPWDALSTGLDKCISRYP